MPTRTFSCDRRRLTKRWYCQESRWCLSPGPAGSQAYHGLTSAHAFPDFASPAASRPQGANRTWKASVQVDVMGQGPGQEAEPVLAPLGLSQGQERIYLTLLELGGEHTERLADVLDLPAQAVAMDLSNLAALGLVARQDTAASGRCTAVAPDVAVTAALMQRQLALLKVQARIDTLMQTYRSRAVGVGPPAQLIRSPEEIRECFVHLQRTARQEVLSFTRLPFALALHRNDTELEMLEPGVDYRAVYERAVLAQPGAREQVRGYLNAGEQARAARSCPASSSLPTVTLHDRGLRRPAGTGIRLPPDPHHGDRGRPEGSVRARLGPLGAPATAR